MVLFYFMFLVLCMSCFILLSSYKYLFVPSFLHFFIKIFLVSWPSGSWNYRSCKSHDVTYCVCNFSKFRCNSSVSIVTKLRVRRPMSRDFIAVAVNVVLSSPQCADVLWSPPHLQLSGWRRPVLRRVPGQSPSVTDDNKWCTQFNEAFVTFTLS
jgi:hypothetical protein